MLAPTRIARGIFDEQPNLAGALAADPDAPAVAFPVPANPVACEPLELVWFYSGNFPDDATLDISITNVNVLQRPPDSTSSSSSPSGTTTSASLESRDTTHPFWSRHFRRQGPQDAQEPLIPVTATLVHATPVRTTNHSFLLPQLRVPPGYYYSLQGSSADLNSKTIFYPSARFLVAQGSDTSCLQSSSTASTTLPSSSRTPTPSSTSSISGSKESAISPDPQTHEISKGTIIAGAVGGALAVAVLLATFFAVRHFRKTHRKYSNVDAVPPSSGWRSSQAVAHAASPGPLSPAGGAALSSGGTLTNPFSPPAIISPAMASPGDSPPAPFTPPPTAPLSSAATPGPARNSMLASISDSDLRKKLSTTPSTWTENTVETRASSLNAQLGEAFIVPVTPAIVHDGVMSRQSSVGSGRNVGPAIISPPAQTATAQFVTLPAERPAHLDVPSPAFSQTSTSRSSNGTIISTSQALQMLSRGT